MLHWSIYQYTTSLVVVATVHYWYKRQLLTLVSRRVAGHGLKSYRSKATLLFCPIVLILAITLAIRTSYIQINCIVTYSRLALIQGCMEHCSRLHVESHYPGLRLPTTTPPNNQGPFGDPFFSGLTSPEVEPDRPSADRVHRFETVAQRVQIDRIYTTEPPIGIHCLP